MRTTRGFLKGYRPIERVDRLVNCIVLRDPARLLPPGRSSMADQVWRAEVETYFVEDGLSVDPGIRALAPLIKETVAELSIMDGLAPLELWRPFFVWLRE